jgi:cytochrome b6-f complex iron-sulfur subunit
LQDELLYENMAQAAAIARERITRRRFLRRSMLAVWGLSATSSIGGALYMLYPTLTARFGDVLDLGNKGDFPAATPDQFKLNQAGVFYHPAAKTYLVHLDQDTRFLLTGYQLEEQLAADLFVRDRDGSYWLALYQRCVHLGATVIFRNECTSFICPSHGARYNCDGEYIDGPAPRSMDRFPLMFQRDHVLVDTGKIILVPLTDSATRVLPLPVIACP